MLTITDLDVIDASLQVQEQQQQLAAVTTELQAAQAVAHQRQRELDKVQR
jgi:hypothetical protein